MIRMTTLCTSVAAFAALALSSVDADACGGLFCDGAGPQQVNQAAERIIFAEHPDGSVTSIIQIMYQGPTDRFGWLLPVPGIPEVGLSSNQAFTQLQNATNPQYQMTTRVEGECKTEDFGGNNTFDSSGAQNSATNGMTSGSPNEGITVLDRGTAGPYDYIVIQVDSETGDKAQLALDWLEENNYQVTDVGPELIGPYLDENYNLLAVRLQKSADSGAVRPIRLKYDDDHPMIPIKLTAVAANADMGVMTWVLGDARAVPVNYKSLELNDSLINWFTGAGNYNQVVIAAANEASGQGFVTEYADSTVTMDGIVFSQSQDDQWTQISGEDWAGREWDLVTRVTDAFSTFDNFGNTLAWDGYVEAFDATLPNMTSEERMMLLQCGVWCAFNGELPAAFDAATFLTAFGDFVVDPMKDTQELINDFGYVTRMYTTLSAHEMTLDPSFDFNPDLEAVSNIHNAERIIECHPSIYQWEAPWRVHLPSGLVVRGEANSGWPIQQDDMMPATLEVRSDGTNGAGEVVRDNYETVQGRLEQHNATVPTPGSLKNREVGGGGCSTAPSDLDGGLWALLGAGFLLRRRRRND